MNGLEVTLVALSMLALVAVSVVLAATLRSRTKSDGDREKQLIDVLASIASNESQIRRQEVAIAPSVFPRARVPVGSENGLHVPVDAEEVTLRN